VSAVIKLSCRATRQFYEIPVLFEDEHLLALDKPANLLTSPDPDDPQRPSLMRLLHDGIAQGKPWAKARGLTYLMNTCGLDFEATGVILLARSKAVFMALADLFGSEKPETVYVALVQGKPREARFAVDARLAPYHAKPGLMRVDPKQGKRSRTLFDVSEVFSGYTLLRCRPLTGRMHQIRVHLRHVRLPVVGDTLYGGAPLLLSQLKRAYRLKAGKTERPLIPRAALHAEKLELTHPVTGQPVIITAPWPKDLRVAVKYLRQFVAA